MNITIPKNEESPDVFDYGFSKTMLIDIEKFPMSTSVYDQISDRMSSIIPANQQITNVVPGLLIEEI